jgi:hypothetical protein
MALWRPSSSLACRNPRRLGLGLVVVVVVFVPGVEVVLAPLRAVLLDLLHDVHHGLRHLDVDVVADRIEPSPRRRSSLRRQIRGVVL